MQKKEKMLQKLQKVVNHRKHLIFKFLFFRLTMLSYSLATWKFFLFNFLNNNESTCNNHLI